MKNRRLALLVAKILLAVIVVVVLWFNIPLVFNVPFPFFPPTPPQLGAEPTPSILIWDQSPAVVVLEVGTTTPSGYCDIKNGHPQVQLWGDGRMVWLSAEGTVTREEHLTSEQMNSLLRRTVEEGFFFASGIGLLSPCDYVSIDLVGWHREEGRSVNLHYALHGHSSWTSCQDSGTEQPVDATHGSQDTDNERFFAFYDEMVCGMRELDASAQD